MTIGLQDLATISEYNDDHVQQYNTGINEKVYKKQKAEWCIVRGYVSFCLLKVNWEVSLFEIVRLLLAPVTYMDSKAEMSLELQLASVTMPNLPRRRSMVKSSRPRSFEEALSVHWGLTEACSCCRDTCGTVRYLHFPVQSIW